jgi:hypothetical protein
LTFFLFAVALSGAGDAVLALTLACFLVLGAASPCGFFAEGLADPGVVARSDFLLPLVSRVDLLRFVVAAAAAEELLVSLLEGVDAEESPGAPPDRVLAMLARVCQFSR